MTAATVTSKGQITIPAPVRADLKVGPGDRLEFVRIGDGRYEVAAVTQEVSRLKGRVKAKRPISIEEMNAAIRDRASRT